MNAQEFAQHVLQAQQDLAREEENTIQAYLKECGIDFKIQVDRYYLTTRAPSSYAAVRKFYVVSSQYNYIWQGVSWPDGTSTESKANELIQAIGKVLYDVKREELQARRYPITQRLIPYLQEWLNELSE